MTMTYMAGRGARLIQVIEAITSEGVGTDLDPFRLVTRYYSTDGDLLATSDALTLPDPRNFSRPDQHEFERNPPQFGQPGVCRFCGMSPEAHQ